MQLLIKNLEGIVKQKMSALDGTAYSFNHVARVVKIATFFSKERKS